jgi:hypothetical protein
MCRWRRRKRRQLAIAPIQSDNTRRIENQLHLLLRSGQDIMDWTRLFQTACLGAAIFILVPQADLNAQRRSVTAATAQPNIIFILADDQGWNGTSVQMHPDMPNSKSDFYRTPNIEQLARTGLRFSHAYSPGPMCSPTRASLQTGKSPAQLRMTNVGRGRSAAPSDRLVHRRTPARSPRKKSRLVKL